VQAGALRGRLGAARYQVKLEYFGGTWPARSPPADGAEKNSWQKRRNFEKNHDIKRGIMQAPDSSTILRQGAFAVSARTTGRNFFCLPS
jgi:hypothetical protein